MTTTFYDHWRDVPESAWRWPNFSPAEIACRGTGKLLINEPALDKLQALRDRLGKPQPRAQPCRGRRDPLQAPRWRRLRHRHGKPRPGDVRAGGTGGGVPWLRLLSALGVHPCRPWSRASVGRAVPGPGDRLRRRNATRARGFGRQPHHEGRWRGWRGDAGCAGVEVAQSVLAETQSAILPLVPYLDKLRWVFIAVALGGNLVTIYARHNDWKRGRR